MEADKVAAAIRAKGRRALHRSRPTRPGRRRDPNLCRSEKEFGALDVLVYNAGVSGKEYRLDQAPTQNIRDALDVNTFGCIIHSREAVKAMSTRHGGKGGSIVLLSSRAAAYGSPGLFVWYAASKGAVNSFTVGLAREVGEEGIRVNCVSPGPINTGMTAIETLQKTAQTTALKRVGEPPEVASVILFLASSAASYITGTETLVAGGR